MNARTRLIAMTLSAAATLLLATFLAAAAFAQTPPQLSAATTLMKPSASNPKAVGPALALNSEALKVVTFWRQAGPAKWFAKDPAFDARFRERFLLDHESAARGELAHWQSTPEGALALVLLLDQFPRNAFRGTARMYDTDAMARKAANAALAAGYDQHIERELRKFLVLPFAHSEELADQERSVALARRIGPDDLAHARHHRDIVWRFGRFPHRNAVLGRESTPAETQYLANGGYTG
jgi:uncharacterized protein (DUF924 family)